MRKPTLEYFDLTEDAEKLEEIRVELRGLRDLLLSALQQKKHSILPLCPEWMCVKMFNTDQPIVSCPYWPDCKPESRYQAVEDKLRRKPSGMEAGAKPKTRQRHRS